MKRWLRAVTVGVAFALVGVVGFSWHWYTQAQKAQAKLAKLHISSESTTQAYVDPAPTFNLDIIAAKVNEERAKNGLAPLTRNPLLDKSAEAKCADMVAKDYWSHNAPDGTKTWHFISDTGVSYQSAGENLAYGYPSAPAVVSGWMNSPGHRANILNGNFTDAGYGQCKYDKASKRGHYTLVVQHFAEL